MISFAQGNRILSADEFFEPSVYEGISRFHEVLASGGSPEPLSLAEGELSTDTATSGFFDEKRNELIPFNSIGLGRPLTLLIRHLYTGRYPKGSWFDGT